MNGPLQMDMLVGELMLDEGVRLKPYKDTVGKMTIGIGRNLDDVGITEAEARYLLANDIAVAKHELDRVVPWWGEMSDARQRALLNMAFNLGMPRLRQFRMMLAALESGDWEAAATEALDSTWATQVGARAQRVARMFKEG